MGALPERKALILYGSETGNAQDVAEELGRIAERLRFDTEIAELNAITLGRLLQSSVILISISTTGQGDLPLNSQIFWKALRSTRLRPGCLQQVKFASFGLGDTSYSKFNWAHRKLYNRLVQLGAQPVCDRGEADEQHPEGVDGAFLPWSTKLRQRLIENYPLPDGVEPIPDDVLLDPKWLLDFDDGNDFASQTKNPPVATPSVPKAHKEAIPPLDLLNIPGGFSAKVVSNKRLTPVSHWQDVRHLILDTPEYRPYIPGDTVTIYPKNFPADVEEFLKTMHWEAIADTPLKFTPSSPSTSTASPLPIPNLPLGAAVTLRTLLTNYLDIISIPRRSFFAQLSHFTSDEFHRERLLEFTNPEYIDELYDYTTRPRRSILEVLQEFESVKIPWQRVCSLIPVLRGRQFSIASAQSPLAKEEKHTRIELIVAIVKYRTVMKRIRQGVCTRYVASLTPGQEISITFQRGGLGVTKAETEKPVVMVGPGTGVAPMRALIYQRNYWRQELERSFDDAPKDILFFGCRNAQADFFFKDDWEALKTEGVPLDVLSAFSRDQRRKVYVQDLVRQNSAVVYDTLANKEGVVYICGSSGKMPQAVREALIEVFQSHGSLSREEAEAYLVGMEKCGRYKQETW
ncbi:NADPH dependent diflavin oxidoreductase-like protein 1 [Lindgomyces ingoldianus]|uniref:NADPH dependent diflavin oxidoreductase-like protein 1 n=1 Tax=Lindgomyces ingoldianus TaxID=673940 RepID=A0ACB6RG13_9PLEO|nr:NADPH dependent diflavin oxidoreductase-like protein 1 [Lindgomyces ingoldianus]KAF2477411.1 NADPH dependent diflavin oxidoreductase-like protein 1 [Lindgomyces ingoldianus]